MCAMNARSNLILGMEFFFRFVFCHSLKSIGLFQFIHSSLNRNSLGVLPEGGKKGKVEGGRERERLLHICYTILAE